MRLPKQMRRPTSEAPRHSAPIFLRACRRMLNPTAVHLIKDLPQIRRLTQALRTQFAIVSFQTYRCGAGKNSEGRLVFYRYHRLLLFPIQLSP